MLLIASCCALLTLAAGIFVFRPLFGDPEDSLDILLTAETEADRLLDRKTAIYGNLKDLALEHEMGRLSDEDFRRLEADYKADAALILQKLEGLGVSESLEAAIERDILSRVKGDSAGEAAGGSEKALCPSCGSEVVPGKKFCADCGHKL
ncbi:MAG: zinc ribbon domain-containing protein [Acidobacteria bacterium]|nr:zinc ribbon domain-containing protein [Acidobacteriota bacterium]